MIFDVSDVTVEDVIRGFFRSEKEDALYCLFCGEVFEEGFVYSVGERLADAKKAAGLHVEARHGSVFHALLREDKRRTGLTDAQKDVLDGLYKGLSVGEIAKKAQIAPATVRYQHFHFREKAKQAKIHLALSRLLEEGRRDGGAMPEPHAGATMVDERYMTEDAQAAKIAGTFFSSLNPPVLKSFTTKEKNKLVILKIIAAQFVPEKRYAEKEVNEILKAIYADFATIRRYLIEYGFMDRTADCRTYWRKTEEKASVPLDPSGDVR